MRDAHEALDECKIPRHSSDGKIYTLAQRFKIVRQRYSDMLRAYQYAKKHMDVMLEALPNDLLRSQIEKTRF